MNYAFGVITLIAILCILVALFATTIFFVLNAPIDTSLDGTGPEFLKYPDISKAEGCLKFKYMARHAELAGSYDLEDKYLLKYNNCLLEEQKKLLLEQKKR